ncbi:exopolysaccharide biosynthesis protein [Sulfitobacter sp. S190]|uniref:exopolysaccharide biosynthesis protein n=1 Tax=Sulfitobacter sp. S190 TaxID=2867022 RepID=UPI0021A3764F|nr:exopolysaccharide biosynthesis protein [Sulfitobacter sp. S190]UWR22572.1 exopolysaccharide biosynthesis protein [Sulfitobacter sp. S190]
MTHATETPLNGLLDGIEEAADTGGDVTVRDILDHIGDRSVLPFILLIAVLLVSPLSGIPGVPTVCACMIILLSAQSLIGRRRLWLPGALLRRGLSGKRLAQAVEWLRGPARFIDRHSHPRLRWLTRNPLRIIALSCCVIVPVGWPFLEILPFVSSIGAGTVALLTFGLFARDGLYVLLGYAVIGVTLGAGLYFLV